MSHFTVLVVGDDVEALLAPFHEFECTGLNDQYVQDIDITEEIRSAMSSAEPASLDEALADHGLDERIVFDESEVQKVGAGAFHKYGYAIVKNGELIKAVNRTNPNRRWDWWTEGGRWSGKLKLKSTGGKADSARAGDVDWDGMIAEHGQRAAETFDAVHKVLAGRSVITWQSLLAKRDAGEITTDEARATYNGQPILDELYEAKAVDSWSGAETLSAILSTDRDTYIRREGEMNATTWALLVGDQWTERGEMGWFGMSDADDASTSTAVDTFWSTVRALPVDTLVTVVDCHI